MPRAFSPPPSVQPRRYSYRTSGRCSSAYMTPSSSSRGGRLVPRRRSLSVAPQRGGSTTPHTPRGTAAGLFWLNEPHATPPRRQYTSRRVRENASRSSAAKQATLVPHALAVGWLLGAGKTAGYAPPALSELFAPASDALDADLPRWQIDRLARGGVRTVGDLLALYMLWDRDERRLGM